MPNFGIWELIVILTIIGIPCGIAIMLFSLRSKNALAQIRQDWDNADPRDNHRDR